MMRPETDDSRAARQEHHEGGGEDFQELSTGALKA
jgi:hypothetical protein